MGRDLKGCYDNKLPFDINRMDYIKETLFKSMKGDQEVKDKEWKKLQRL